MAQYCLFITTETLRIISILLQPFIPGKAKGALNMMNVDETKRTYLHTVIGADFEYGTQSLQPGDRVEGLFPALISQD